MGWIWSEINIELHTALEMVCAVIAIFYLKFIAWQISSTSVAENSDIGTAVGTFDTIDVDLNQTDNYRLLNSANGIFRVNSNILEVGVFSNKRGNQ